MTHEESSSEFSHHAPCPNCGSSDALGVYTDGHAYCHSCHHYIPGDDRPRKSRSTKSRMSKMIEGEATALPKRKLKEDTCKKWGYLVGEYKGKTSQIANYRDLSGKLIAQKIKEPPKGDKKKFSWVWFTDAKNSGLYGMHLWKDGGKKLVITEGEIDALSVSQLQNNKWPVVSVPNGAGAAKKDIQKNIEWVEKFDEVVFLFDSDEPGREAAAECAAILSPGKAKIATLPLKDANEMLTAGRGSEVIDCIWQAHTYRPDGIIAAVDVESEAMKPAEWGQPWPWESMTNLTYGRRRGELYFFGAAQGAGKTDVFSQTIAHFIQELQAEVGAIYLEQQPAETSKRIAGKIGQKAFHVPDADWTKEDLVKSLEPLRDKLYYYNHFGCMDWETIKNVVRYFAVGYGIKDIFLDHITALIAQEDDVNKALDKIVADMASMCQELQINLYVISHLNRNTQTKTPFEEGAKITTQNLYGSGAMAKWGHFIFALERNQQAENENERCTTIVRCLKDRNTGRATGKTFFLKYDVDTGILNGVEPPEKQECPFVEEDKGDAQDF